MIEVLVLKVLIVVAVGMVLYGEIIKRRNDV